MDSGGGKPFTGNCAGSIGGCNLAGRSFVGSPHRQVGLGGSSERTTQPSCFGDIFISKYIIVIYSNIRIYIYVYSRHSGLYYPVGIVKRSFRRIPVLANHLSWNVFIIPPPSK